MIFAALSDVLIAVDGFVGFGLGFLVAWFIYRRRPPNRKYTVDLTIREANGEEKYGI